MVNEIFSYLLSRFDDGEYETQQRLSYSNWFVTSLPATEFNNEELLLYVYLEECVKLGSPLKRSYFEKLMRINLREVLLKNSGRIRIFGTEKYDINDPSAIETILRIVTETMLDVFDQLVSLELDGDLEDFVFEAKSFFAEKKRERLIEMYSSGVELLDSIQKYKVGTDDALEYTQVRAAMIADIYDEAKLEELADYEGDNDKRKSYPVTDTGLESVDKSLGVLRTKRVCTIGAPPGVGKTRFALGTLIYRAAVVHKKNGAFCALEQEKEEIESMLISIHTLMLYGIYVDDKWINEELIEDEALKRKVDTAKFDLFESGNYGTIHIRDKDLYINNITQTLDVMDKQKGPFDYFVVDHMNFLSFKPEKGIPYMDRTERTIEGYRRLKPYSRNKNKLIIAINQLNKEGIIASSKDETLTEDMFAGGTETAKTSDYIIALGATEEMKAQRKRRLQNPKNRTSEPFGKKLLEVAMGSCYFNESVKGKL